MEPHTARGALSLGQRVSRWVRTVPVAVWLITGLFVSIMGAYTVLYLPYTNPDEAQHHDMVIAWLHGQGLDDPGTRWIAVGVGKPWAETIPEFYNRQLTSKSPDPRPRPTFDEEGGPGRYNAKTFPIVGYPYPNQMTQHPQLYYAGLAAIVKLIPGGSHLAWDQNVGILRIVNLLLLAALPVLAWAAARMLTRSFHVAVAASMAPLLLPGIARVGSSINNDNLLTLLAGILTVLLLRVCLGDLRLRLAVWVGVVAGLALITKGFALAFPPVIVAAYFVGWYRRGAKAPWSETATALVVAFVVGGWWWVRNVIRFGAVQPNGFGADAFAQVRGPAAAASAPRPIGDFLSGYTHQMGIHTVAWLGLLDDPMFSPVLAHVMLALFGAGLVLAFALRRRSRVPGLVGVVLVLPLLGIAAILTKGVYDNWVKYLALNGTQGRYLYPSIVGVGVVAIAGWSGLLGRARRALPLVVLLAAGVMQFAAAKTIVEAFWLPANWNLTPGHARDAFAAIARWSPWPVGLTIVPFIGIFCFGLAAAASVIEGCRLTEIPPPPEPAVAPAVA